jgi:putative salt-induced outer membrane protein YdiY
MTFRTNGLALLLALASVASTTPAQAQEEEKELGWSSKAEFSLVSTSGNSETDTLGLSAAFAKIMERSSLLLTARSLRAEATAISRSAVGPSPADFALLETSTSTLSAEQYSLGGRFDKQISDVFFWYTGLRWEKNEFAGFSERLTAVGGVGNIWFDDESARFSTGYGLTYTTQDDLVPTAGLQDSFLGAQLSYDYWRKINASTEFGSTLVLDQNLDETEDLRADFINWVSVSLSAKLALKVSFQALYDNLPALGVLPLEFPAGTPTGDTVTYELDTTDTILTTALVVTF